MSDIPSDKSRLALTLLAALWLIVFVYAFVAYSTAPYEGAGYPDGLNKPAVFLGWQGIAGLLALAIFGVSRAWPTGSGVRRAGAAPLIFALLLVLAIVAILAWHGVLV